MATIKMACPLFPSADIERSMAFYRDQLGFRSAAAYGDEYGIVERDGVEIHFWPCDDRNIAENTSAYFRTDDVDSLHDDVERLATEARITAPVTRPWGMREFYVWDPDGNLLKFGQPAAEG